MKKLADIKQNFPEWYQDIVYEAQLADQAPVKGCMVVRPYGCALWDAIKAVLDKKIKDTGHQNALFPLLIPLSFIQKESKHVEGFAPELWTVTRVGDKELEEPYVIRPTSETIIHYMFAQWIQSWRDLPLKINQWANVMRAEMRTRPFLRTSEFFWQEGHTAHETLEEAEAEAELMLNEYIDLVENYLAIPVFGQEKPESERFAGADRTFTLEGIMPDGKALQMGTSHLISQSFAKAFGINFQNRNGEQAHPFLTSWGITTRLIGAVVMVHGDQKGLILPPKIAPIQVVVVPIFRKGMDQAALIATANQIAQELKKQGIAVVVDLDEQETPGAKFYKWELKGVPVRVEIGPRDLEQNQAIVVDRLGMGKVAVSLEHIAQEILVTLTTVQVELFKRAKEKRDSLIKNGTKLDQFGTELAEGGFAYRVGWCQSPVCENMLKAYKATIRCLLETTEHAECFNCNTKSVCDVLVAKSY
jgi:prolyl-tRNA synthetase